MTLNQKKNELNSLQTSCFSNKNFNLNNGWLINGFSGDKSFSFLNFPSVSINEQEGISTIFYRIIVPAFVVYLILFILFGLYTVLTTTVTSILYFNFSKESENEPGSIDDISLVKNNVIFFIALYAIVLKVFFFKPTVIASPLIMHTLFLASIIFFFPATLSLLFGAYIMNYLRGDSNSNSNLYAGVFDLANLFGFFKRFCVQFIRYVLITVKIALFYHFVLKSIKGKLLEVNIKSSRVIIDGFKSTVLSDIKVYTIYLFEFIAEIFNIFVVYYAQMGAFCIVLFWLLKALYSSAWPVIKIVWFKFKK